MNRNGSYGAAPGYEERDTVYVLFVGNSLTYCNDLPQLVTAAAKKNGILVRVEVLAEANYSLEDHWNEGRLQRLVAGNKFDYVVVQQGPSSQEEGYAMLRGYGAKIKLLCERYHSKLAFYMVWPAKANLNAFEKVIRNYRAAAAATGSILCPVGEAWRRYFETTGDYSLYGPDGFHPSLKGSEMAARVLVDSLFPLNRRTSHSFNSGAPGLKINRSGSGRQAFVCS